MKYGKITAEIIRALSEIVGAENTITDAPRVAAYLYDEVELAYRPQAAPGCVVVRPAHTQEVAAIMRLANAERLPVTVRGGGTGLAGGCTPAATGIIMSMGRMNKILEIDEGNMVAVLQAGVTLMDLLEELEGYDKLSFPVHPGDEGAEMGGMVVTNAGGARAVRLGAMRRHIMGLEVVLADGSILNLGSKSLKNNAGYDLKQMIIGSEGTLAIVTKVILKIFPREKYSATIIAPFAEVADACQAVMEILRSGNPPMAVEYMDKRLFVDTAKMLGLKWQAEYGKADILIMLSEMTESRLYEAVSEVNRICEVHGAVDCLYADKETEQKEILDIRSQHYELIKDEICDSFDMAVPVAAVPDFIVGLKSLAHSYGTDTNIVGHIADGNVHNDILLMPDGKVPEYAEELKRKMYDLCLGLGGTITGEHGIGKIRIDDLREIKPREELELMRGIKAVFDPLGILNPGTVI